MRTDRRSLLRGVLGLLVASRLKKPSDAADLPRAVLPPKVVCEVYGSASHYTMVEVVAGQDLRRGDLVEFDVNGLAFKSPQGLGVVETRRAGGADTCGVELWKRHLP